MKKNKIFGIGATVLMILVTVIPAVNGIQINGDKNGNNFSNLINKISIHDLKIEIVGEPYAKDGGNLVVDGEEYAIWIINYRIYNKDTEEYTGKPFTAVIPEEDETVIIDWWYEVNIEDGKEKPITIPGEDWIDRSHEIKVSCKENLERYFWDKKIHLECGLAGGQERTPWDNVDIERTWKFWNNKMPTFGQLQGFGEHSKEKIINLNSNGIDLSLPIPKFMENDKYFPRGFNGLKNTIVNGNSDYQGLIDFENLPHSNKDQLGLGDKFHIYDIYEITDDYQIIGGTSDVSSIQEIWDLLERFVDYIFEELPEAWFNHRFGWVNKMTLYRSRILIDLIAFGLFCIKFYEDGMQEFNHIADWLADFIMIIVKTITTGMFPWNDFVVFIEEIPFILADMLELIRIFFEKGYSIIFYAIIEKLCLDFKKLKLLKGEEPWKDPITVYGNVGQLEPGEVVKITTSRGGETEVRENNGEYYINDITSVWMKGDLGIKTNNDPEGYKAFHLCTITCDGSKHKPITTRKFASYCFSGGEIHRIFLLNEESEKDGGGKTKIIDNPISSPNLGLKQKIQENLPLLQYIENLIQHSRLFTMNPNILLNIIFSY